MIQKVTYNFSFTQLLKTITVSSLFSISLFANDMDNDLVPDSSDICPNTPEGVFVDHIGCTQIIEKVIHFEHASWTIDLKAKEILDGVVTLANELKGYKIYIQGHTDATADSKTNLYYSKQRAANVFDIISKSIDKKRIVVSWYGESQPIASNTTDEGRQSNRRVSIILR